MPSKLPQTADRLMMREAPPGESIMYQAWHTLLFMHWPMPQDLLRPLIPPRLSIDTFNDQAWIGITPFTVRDAHPVFLPPLPWISDFHEINVRTYVHLDGVPGVWFFSLDASSLAAVLGARFFFRLPYHHASIDLVQQEETVHYRTKRLDDNLSAVFNATWVLGDDLPPAAAGTLEFFLIERYCLYAADSSGLYRCRVHHEPWPLRRATLSAFQSSMIVADGLPAPEGEPLLHAGGPVHVQVWPLEEV